MFASFSFSSGVHLFNSAPRISVLLSPVCSVNYLASTTDKMFIKIKTFKNSMRDEFLIINVNREIVYLLMYFF